MYLGSVKKSGERLAQSWTNAYMNMCRLKYQNVQISQKHYRNIVKYIKECKNISPAQIDESAKYLRASVQNIHN